MKNKRMLHILNEIDDALIAEAAPKEEAAPKTKTPKHRDWIKWSVAAACFCLLLIGTIFAVQGGLFTKTPGKSVEDHGWMIRRCRVTIRARWDFRFPAGRKWRFASSSLKQNIGMSGIPAALRKYLLI